MNKKINISIIGTRGYPYVYSGYETFVKQLSERLVLKDCNVTIYCHKGLFEIRPKEIKGIKLVYVPTIETKILSQPIHSFLSIIHACFSNTDVVLVVNSANGPFGLITKLFRIPTAINVDGLEWLRPKWKGLGSIYFKWASKMATFFYDQIINDSDEMRKVYLNLFKRDSKVIAYGADIRKSKNPDLINKWNLKQRDYYLVIGRLIPDNNADLIIEGFLKSSSNKKLVIVGDVPYKDSYASDLKNMVDKRLIFTGYVKDQDILAELYHNCYVYVHGHEFGGTNPTMIKAMAYGSAVLALDTVFNQEMLQNGKYGLFFKKECSSVTNMVNYCEKENLIIDKFRLESTNGITEKYDWEFIVEEYIKILKKLTLSEKSMSI
jgi:glycosyltransferase involved in cell wall biosynthesis